MLSRINCLLGFIAICGIVCSGGTAVLAQDSAANFQKILREKAAFNETDFAALEQGQTLVRPLPVTDKREVAVYGVVRLQASAEVFLQSFRESMTQKSNPAILEIGRFSVTPTLDDLQALTFEDRDLEDLKECVVGDCKLKLSAVMIQRLQKEIDWQGPDYKLQATRLLKLMLVEYMDDYLERGDVALIKYNDKPEEVRLAEEHRGLMAASSYVSDVLPEFRQHYSKGLASPDITLVENAIVWSKTKLGLKPVIAFNHIMVYKREQESGPQIIVASKQIYANHYFDSSLALTAFVNVPDTNPGSYLIYENHSRADGLEGAFSKMKRGIVEGKAVNGLKTILESSKANLNARTLSGTEPPLPISEKSSWSRLTVNRFQVFLSLLLVTAFVGLLALGNYNWKGGLSRGARH